MTDNSQATFGCFGLLCLAEGLPSIFVHAAATNILVFPASRFESTVVYLIQSFFTMINFWRSALETGVH